MFIIKWNSKHAAAPLYSHYYAHAHTGSLQKIKTWKILSCLPSKPTFRPPPPCFLYSYKMYVFEPVNNGVYGTCTLQTRYVRSTHVRDTSSKFFGRQA